MAIHKEELLKLIFDLINSTVSSLGFIKLLLLDHPYYADDDSLLSLPLPISGSGSGSVSLPAFTMDMNLIKNRLPLLTFGDFQRQNRMRSRNVDDEEEETCAICLSWVETQHEVRQLPNCSHVFHKDCLDSWMDQRQVTCPTCRSDLITLPSSSVPKYISSSSPRRRLLLEE